MRMATVIGMVFGVPGDGRRDEFLDGGVEGVIPELINGGYGFEGVF